MNIKRYAPLAVVLAAGCASAPQPNAALERARAQVQAAETDPNVSKYDALDLQSAKQQLDVAQNAWLHHDDKAVDQPAYLSAQLARLSQLKGAAKADDARVAQGQTERDKIQLAARSREVTNAQAARDKAAAESARLQAEVDALKAKPTDRGLVLTLGDVLFDTGKAELNSGATRKLDQLAQFLNEHPDRRLQIDGFTDSVGGDSYNLDLSQRRADAVRTALVTRGIDASRISTQGYGPAYPVASNSDSGGRQLNRRVEVVIGDENGAAVASRR